MSPIDVPPRVRSQSYCNKRKTLLHEMQHRVANSLQIIAGILLLKARTVQSEETRTAGFIVVAYEATETSWRLAVSDNGIGTPEGYLKSPSGLGTIIIEALANSLTPVSKSSANQKARRHQSPMERQIQPGLH
jgi:two-component sensor histidine kinase